MSGLIRQYIISPKAQISAVFRASCDIAFVGCKCASGAVKRGGGGGTTVYAMGM